MEFKPAFYQKMKKLSLLMRWKETKFFSDLIFLKVWDFHKGIILIKKGSDFLTAFSKV
jgi:hypothetical protein